MERNGSSLHQTMMMVIFLLNTLLHCIHAVHHDATHQLNYDIMEKLGKLTDKTFTHYYHRFYPNLFAQQNINRSSSFKMLEIGFGQGGSVPLWENLFPNANITWIDYSPVDHPNRATCVPNQQHCQATLHFSNESHYSRSRFYHGSQSNVTFLQSVVQEQCGDVPCFDIIIDDGGHGYVQQLTSFHTLFSSALVHNGLYIIEDIETSWWTYGEQYNDLTYGGRNAPHTPVNVWKRFADVINHEFFDHEYVADVRTKEVERFISSISFHQNMMTATKKTKFEMELDVKVFNNRKYRFRNRVEGWRAKSVKEDGKVKEDEEDYNNQGEAFDSNWCVERMHRLPSRGRDRSSGSTGIGRSMEDPDAISLFHELCARQGIQTSCSKQRTVHYSIMGEGIGSGFHLFAHALTFAMADARILVEDVDHFIDLEIPDATSFHTYFTPPTPCPNHLRMECYLAPIHRCTKETVITLQKERNQMSVFNIGNVMTNDNDGTFVEKATNKIRTVRLAWYSFREAQLKHGWGSVQKWLPKQYQHRGSLWYKSQLLWWLIQPSLRVSNQVRKLQQEMKLDILDPKHDKIIVMHVRRGDKALDPIIQQQQQQPANNFQIPLFKYVEAARELKAIHFSTRSPLRILLMTEDASVIEETTTSRYQDVIWYYTTGHARQTKPIKISEAIREGHMNGDDEMMHSLSNLFLSVVEGDAFVGSFSSNWSRLVFELMIGKNRGVVVPHKSMDLAWYP